MRVAGLLAGKVVLITGAASGIGAAAARLAAREGALLCLADIDHASAEAVASEIRRAGTHVVAGPVDIVDDNSVAGMVASVKAEFGRLDGAFLNAGVGTVATGSAGKRLHEIPDDGWEQMMAVNLGGVWRSMKHVLGVIKPGGSIVNTASIAGVVGLPAAAAYVAAKHGVVGLTRAAAIDYGPDGIRVNALCPGYVDTPMTEHTASAKRARITGDTPLSRFASADEMAEAAVWLLSDRSSFTTGATILADGGYAAR